MLDIKGLVGKQKIKNVLSWRRKLSVDNDGSLRVSAREFQVIGPATEKAQWPYVDLL